MLKLGVLCSGELGLNTLVKIIRDHLVSFVMTDKKSINIIELCRKNDIPNFTGNPRKGKGFSFIKNFDVDLIVSINYLFLIEDDIINHSNKLTFNIHGSLLPKYRGRTPHVWAIINGETTTGVTAHKIDSGCDTGEIIRQVKIPIKKDDTGATILSKYTTLYYPLIKAVIKDVKKSSLKLRIQSEQDASFYGKRTPEDGEINWNWPKENIRNWVRAQAYPYPGAFTFYNGKKIIIDKVSFCDHKVNKNQINGTILKSKPQVIVKTNNGALRLDKIRSENCTFISGKSLGHENRE